jgi:hypothetical protein
VLGIQPEQLVDRKELGFIGDDNATDRGYADFAIGEGVECVYGNIG